MTIAQDFVADDLIDSDGEYSPQFDTIKEPALFSIDTDEYFRWKYNIILNSQEWY